MVENWQYTGDGKFSRLRNPVPEEFGCSDFMEIHYNVENTYPSYASNAFIKCFEVRHSFSEELPRFVIDLQFGNGDILCFDASWQVIDYLTHIIPFINFEKTRT